MLKRYFLALVLLVLPLQVAAQLPDFTDLVEKHGGAVVNISTTQTSRSPAAGGRLPNIPEDDPLYEFFRRFMPGPGTPGAPGQGTPPRIPVAVARLGLHYQQR